MVHLVYFAWVRERIGKSEEDIDLPADVTTARQLIHHLTTLGEDYKAAFQFPDVIRVAVNQEHIDHHESIIGAREIGIFPPMTGG
ncbi:molybdopterin converting factor subunit 1 [Agrobacterium sp. rho-13.3]|uniref:molybdopterin converting factor subunit 1 n=1 Tax=Agrobacterium sp. rho-13.3 TaxID=3072980 RepID=UPI002A0AC51F|nr:molybdopterin converting factor subunit 1 [Agrobacterium sp. rho-13.3]MDX8308968.1 molybdopterin converting factor subunit 1 [Agrobacterium sp. rho-13.3]